MSALADLEAAVRKTVLLYNRLKSPHAVAKAISVSEGLVVVNFSGSFCYDCGDVQKYVDDFAKDFKVFVDYLELTGGKAKQVSSNSFDASFIVKTR